MCNPFMTGTSVDSSHWQGAFGSDLVFGAKGQLRAVAEVYAGSDGHKRFVSAFVKAWHKMLMLDRFDVKV